MYSLSKTRRSIKCLVPIILIFMMAGCINFGSEAGFDSTLSSSNKAEINENEMDEAFNGTIILGRPTLNTIEASVMSNSDCEVYLVWGSESNQYSFSSPVQPLREDVSENIVMNELLEGDTNYYRLAYRDLEDNSFNYTEEYSFQMPRARGESFSFVMQSDSHLLNKADPELYMHSMEIASSLKPDFFLDLGDTFLNDQSKGDIEPSLEEIEERYIQQRHYFDVVCKEAPLYLTIGNHEGEYGSYFDGTLNNIAAKSTSARTKYYINPIPNEFYTGNTEQEPLFGYPQNYFAYTWGDALFVSIDPYRYSTVVPYGDSEENNSGWDWTLGKTQYDWFRETLEESDAKYKFVLSHHAIGNMRGGAKIAELYEWGGHDRKGKYLFDEMRPDWGKPIQQIMEEEGVTAFFQGHDHLFSREAVGSVTYVTLPKPAEVVADRKSNHADFPSGDNLMNSGILQVRVSSEIVEIDYIRHFLVANDAFEDNTGVVYSFTIDQDRNVEVQKYFEDDFSKYGSNEESLGSKKSSSEKSNKDNLMSEELDIEIAPVPEGGFSFSIQADSHLDEKTDAELYTSTLKNMALLEPSFVIDLGDTSMAEKLTSSELEVDARYALAKSYLDILGNIPLYLVTGNHDGENGYGSYDGQMTKWALENRLKYFPFPADTHSFTGDVTSANYYSFTKENALFVVLDPFTYTTEKTGKADGWASTLGEEQYLWLKETLEKSNETFKFVFIHHLAGGYGKDQRGGAEAAALYEWGGYESINATDDEDYTFSKNRTGWIMPIHDLLKTNGVDVVFHGHDHFYARQDKDEIVYQLVPQPGTPGNSFLEAEKYSYMSGTILPSAGFLRVVVSESEARVEYLKTFENGDFTVVDFYNIQE